MNNDSLSLFVFPCASTKNIQLGCRHRLRAFESMRQSHKARNFNSAVRNLTIGSPGRFYHSGGFTVPFLIYSMPDWYGVVSNIWNGNFVLPTKIYTLGTTKRRMGKSDFERLDAVQSGGVCLSGIASRLKRFVDKFDPWTISRKDWITILEVLGSKPAKS